MAEKAEVGPGGPEVEEHERLETLEQLMGYRFNDRQGLHHATIHRSYANESEEDIADNEVLEFLGDAVLGLVVSELLYRRNPDLTEERAEMRNQWEEELDLMSLRRPQDTRLAVYLMFA